VAWKAIRSSLTWRNAMNSFRKINHSSNSSKNVQLVSLILNFRLYYNEELRFSISGQKFLSSFLFCLDRWKTSVRFKSKSWTSSTKSWISTRIFDLTTNLNIKYLGLNMVAITQISTRMQALFLKLTSSNKISTIIIITITIIATQSMGKLLCKIHFKEISSWQSRNIMKSTCETLSTIEKKKKRSKNQKSRCFYDQMHLENNM